jgi:hypothetical protein
MKLLLLTRVWLFVTQPISQVDLLYAKTRFYKGSIVKISGSINWITPGKYENFYEPVA